MERATIRCRPSLHTYFATAQQRNKTHTFFYTSLTTTRHRKTNKMLWMRPLPIFLFLHFLDPHPQAAAIFRKNEKMGEKQSQLRKEEEEERGLMEKEIDFLGKTRPCYCLLLRRGSFYQVEFNFKI